MLIRDGGLEDGRVRDLLAFHLSAMRAGSPPGQAFALDADGLQTPGVTLYTAWIDEQPVGLAALRRLDDGTGELKSMRTRPDHLRRGVGEALLRHVIAVARAERLTRLSLETGSGAAFEPALALYRRHGFRRGAAFGDYRSSEFNQFWHLEL